MTTDIVLGIVVCALTWMVLRGGWYLNTRKMDLRPKGQAIGLGVVAVLAAVFFFGPLAGIALIVSVIVHEFGHVAAYRVAGHSDATFRLIPLIGGVAISSKTPKSDLHQFYISIMGPGISLALMVVSYLLFVWLFPISEILASFFWFLAMITGLMNFMNLLPLYPLDGGKITRVLTQQYSPKFAYYVTIVMCVLFFVVSIYNRSLLMAIIAVMAFKNAKEMPQFRTRMGMSTGQVITGTSAYILMMIAFLMGGWPFVSLYL